MLPVESARPPGVETPDAAAEACGLPEVEAEALARIPALVPDVAVLDVRLPDGTGVELCRDLRSRMPQLSCLMLTSFTDEQAMLDAVVAGASGYVITDVRGNDIVNAVREVGAGRQLLDNRAASALMSRFRHHAAKPDPPSSPRRNDRCSLTSGRD